MRSRRRPTVTGNLLEVTLSRVTRGLLHIATPSRILLRCRRVGDHLDVGLSWRGSEVRLHHNDVGGTARVTLAEAVPAPNPRAAAAQDDDAHDYSVRGAVLRAQGTLTVIPFHACVRLARRAITLLVLPL